MNDPLDLKQFIRTVNDFPIKGIKFRDITSLIENPIAFRLTCDELTKITKKFDGNIIAEPFLVVYSTSATINSPPS